MATMAKTTTPSHGAQAFRGDERVATLTIVQHPDVEKVGIGRVVPRTGGLALGRDPRSSFNEALDTSGVSRSHARVERAGHEVVILDADSKNGSWLNGVRVTRAPLHDGDLVRVGAVLLYFHHAPRRTSAPADPHLKGISPEIRELIDDIELVAPRGTTALVLGETGTGKELVAHAIHQRSGRPGPLVPVDCTGLSDSLLGSELFGHGPGAYTGASQRRAGLVEAARGGTLFIDELGDASPRLQGALLRLLESGTYRPLGDDRERQADVRVVVAAQPSVEAMVADQRMRLDLWTRLARWVVRVPPLRQRKMDIPVLAQRFALELDPGTGAAQLTARLVERLMQHTWPGNVRELRAVVERLIVHARGERPVDVQPWLEASLTGPQPDKPSAAGAADEAKQPEPEPPEGARTPVPTAEELLDRVRRLGGNVRAMALGYGVSRRTLYRWLSAAGIDPDHHRKA